MQINATSTVCVPIVWVLIRLILSQLTGKHLKPIEHFLKLEQTKQKPWAHKQEHKENKEVVTNHSGLQSQQWAKSKTGSHNRWDGKPYTICHPRFPQGLNANATCTAFLFPFTEKLQSVSDKIKTHFAVHPPFSPAQLFKSLNLTQAYQLQVPTHAHSEKGRDRIGPNGNPLGEI